MLGGVCSFVFEDSAFKYVAFVVVDMMFLDDNINIAIQDQISHETFAIKDSSLPVVHIYLYR